MFEFIRNRFSVLKHFEKKAVSDGYNVSVIFVVEDYAGLREGIKMAMSEMVDEWINRIYFTSEHAVYSSENIVSSFLKIPEVNEGKPTLMACSKFDYI